MFLFFYVISVKYIFYINDFFICNCVLSFCSAVVRLLQFRYAVMWIVFCKQHQSCSQKTVHTAACLNCSSRTTALQKDDTQGLARQWPQSHTFSSAGNIYRKRSLHLFRCAVSDKISWSINAGSTPRKKKLFRSFS